MDNSQLNEDKPIIDKPLQKPYEDFWGNIPFACSGYSGPFVSGVCSPLLYLDYFISKPRIYRTQGGSG